MKRIKSKLKHIIPMLLVVFFAACGLLPQKEGQKQPLVSPSGHYTIEMPILRSNRNLDYPVWTPTIKNKRGEIIYTDSLSTLSGYHSSYWDWSKDNSGNDILWVYDSDNGTVFIYRMSYGKWKKSKYDIEKGELNPPEIIGKKLHRN
jgi:hypothetical protein